MTRADAVELAQSIQSEICATSSEPTACLRDCSRSAAEARSPTCCTPDYGLLIELDGRIGHTGDGRFRDMRRDNAAATDGLATLRYGWHDVSGAA